MPSWAGRVWDPVCERYRYIGAVSGSPSNRSKLRRWITLVPARTTRGRWASFRPGSGPMLTGGGPHPSDSSAAQLIKVKSGFIGQAASGCDEAGQSPGLRAPRTVQKRDRGVDGRSCITLLTDSRSATSHRAAGGTGRAHGVAVPSTAAGSGDCRAPGDSVRSGRARRTRGRRDAASPRRSGPGARGRSP